MSRISAKVNLETRDWDIEYYDSDPIYVDVLMGFNRGEPIGTKVPFYGLAYGFEVIKDGETEPFYFESYPPENVTYLSTDQEFMQRSNLTLENNTEYKILFWVSDKGESHQIEFDFITPDATVRYPSFVWDGEMWRAPIDYPDDGKMYIWNEMVKNWVLLDEDAEIDEVSQESARDPLKPNATSEPTDVEPDYEGSHWLDKEKVGWEYLFETQNVGSNPDANISEENQEPS